MTISWKRTLRTPSSERFLAQRGGKDVAAIDLHYLANASVAVSAITQSAPPENHLLGFKVHHLRM